MRSVGHAEMGFEMISVQGTISAGEGQATLAAIGRRQRGSIIPYFLIGMLLVNNA